MLGGERTASLGWPGWPGWLEDSVHLHIRSSRETLRGVCCDGDGPEVRVGVVRRVTSRIVGTWVPGYRAWCCVWSRVLGSAACRGQDRFFTVTG